MRVEPTSSSHEDWRVSHFPNLSLRQNFCYVNGMSASPEETPDVKVSFGPHKTLEINDRIIEAADLSAAALSDLVTLASDDIHQEIRLSLAETQLLHPESLQRLSPVILIARLALLHHKEEVLTRDALLKHTQFFHEPGALTHDYLEYWHSVNIHDFSPEVRIVPGFNRRSGVWLGVYSQDEGI